MTAGPVSYTVVAFPGNRFNGNVAPEIEKLVANGTVRILDLVFVFKDENGDTLTLEFDQLEELAPFGDLEGEVGGLINQEDLDHVADQLPAGEFRPRRGVGGPVGQAARRGGQGLGRRGDRFGTDPGRSGRRRARGAVRGPQELREHRERERQGVRPCL